MPRDLARLHDKQLHNVRVVADDSRNCALLPFRTRWYRTPISIAEERILAESFFVRRDVILKRSCGAHTGHIPGIFQSLGPLWPHS